MKKHLETKKQKPAPSTVEQSKNVRERMKALTQRVNEWLEHEDDEGSRLQQPAVVSIRR